MRAAVLLVLAGVALTGCENSCQALCQSMADLSEECGRTISDAELEACYDDYASPTGRELGYCADYATPDALRRAWDCSDVNLFREAVDEAADGE